MYLICAMLKLVIVYILLLPIFVFKIFSQRKFQVYRFGRFCFKAEYLQLFKAIHDLLRVYTRAVPKVKYTT